MRFEETREIPVSVKKIWDYATDPMTWPRWYSGITEIIDPETAAWGKVGDTVKVAYSVLGRRLEFPCTIEEYEEHKLVRFATEMPGPLPRGHQIWHWTDLGDDKMAFEVVMEGEDSTNWFGKLIDKMVLPHIYQRDLKDSLDNLANIAAVDLTE
jgi:uncharacterized protein YndB with AHSA1/START domain